MAKQTDNHSVRKKRRPKPRPGSGRIYLVGGFLGIGLLFVVWRLMTLQIVEADRYAAQARRQYESRVSLQADRGAIFDRNKNLLATNAVSYSFAVDPTMVENPEVLAGTFAELFGGEYQEYFDKITTDSTAFVWIERKVKGPELNRLKKLDDQGLIKIPEPMRRFEYGTLAAQVVGCTNIDNNGLSGIEFFYDELLHGEDGYMIMQRDARGRRRPDVDLPHSDPEHGDALVLTIDVNIQGIVEDELFQGVQHAGAESGTAIALDPATGEILAMASYPTFDPNDLANATQSAIRVRAITDTYEPGSTMKIVTAAAALEEGLMEPESEIDAEGGLFEIEGHTIRDDHALGLITFREAIEQSSNIAFAKIASQMSEPRFYKYVRDFGFGIVTGVDLPGEARGEVKKPNDFTEGTQEFMAFGYQLAVTPLQLACAYGLVANGGLMMKPHVLKRRIDGEGNIVQEVEPQEIRRVISRETADTLTAMLVNTVDEGTGKHARIPGVKIAGKTGTAQQLYDGSYSKEKYNASFVGFFPADNPKVVLLVLLDSPSNGYYGGQVAAPIFRKIARRIINATMHEEDPSLQFAMEEAAEEYSEEEATETGIVVPDVRGMKPGTAQKIMERHGFRTMATAEGTVVTGQQPDPGAFAEPKSVVQLLVDNSAREGSASVETGGTDVMPDVRGMTLRRALNVLGEQEIRPRAEGSGIVRTQWPSPGTPLREKERVAKLTCSAVEW